MPVDKTGDCKTDAMVESDVEMDVTPLPRSDTAVEMPSDVVACVLRADEMNADSWPDTEATRDTWLDPAVEMPVDSDALATCSVEAATDNDADVADRAVLLAAVLDAAVDSVTEIMEYSAGPASSVAAISNNVSRDAGAAPTNEVTAVSTCDERFTICALNAAEMDAASDARTDTPLSIALDSDKTLEFRWDTATVMADPCVEVTVCSETPDCAVVDATDDTDALRSPIWDIMPD